MRQTSRPQIKHKILSFHESRPPPGGFLWYTEGTLVAIATQIDPRQATGVWATEEQQ